MGWSSPVGGEFLSLLKTLRERWPQQKPYAVLDNFSPHKHAEVRT
ncbi:hypothetical protein [Streptomyces sp. NPDC001604]